MYVNRIDENNAKPFVSDPERAALEMLSEVGLKQSLSEAEEILEGALFFRNDVLRHLIENCVSLKTVNLFYSLAAKLNLPYQFYCDLGLKNESRVPR